MAGACGRTLDERQSFTAFFVVQVSAVEVLAPVFGTQKRGSNTGRVSSCTSSQTIWLKGGFIMT